MPPEHKGTWYEDFAELDAAERAFQRGAGNAPEEELDPGITTTETPRYLVPDPDHPIAETAHFRSITLLGEGAEGEAARSLEEPLDVMDAVTEVGATEPVIGVRLTHEQAWRLKGSALGGLHHSLSLAPGEVTQIAMVERRRDVRARTTSTTDEIERVRRESERQSNVQDIVSSAQRETQFGSSLAMSHSSSAEAGGGGLAGLMGFTGGASQNSSSALQVNTSAGSRKVSARATERVRQATQESVAAARSERSTTVQEVSEELSEEFRTRVVANYNHMHALNMQYYEVVQVHELAARVTDAERCLFIPMKMLRFDLETIRRFQRPLAEAARAIGALALASSIEMIDMDDKVQRKARLEKEHENLLVEKRGLKAEHQKCLELMAIEVPEPGTVFSPNPELMKRGIDKTILGRLQGLRSQLENVLKLMGLSVANDPQFSDENIAGRIKWFVETPAKQIAEENLGAAFPGGGSEKLFKSIAEANASILRTVVASKIAAPQVALRTIYEAQIVPLLRERDRVIATVKQEKRAAEARTKDISKRMQVLAPRLTDLQTQITNLGLALQKEDLEALQAELEARRLYFNQAIWVQMDATAVGQLVGGKTYQGENLSQTLDPKPISVFGNLVGFRWRFGAKAGDDAEDPTDGPEGREAAFRARFVDAPGETRGSRVIDRVAVPTGGLFAEAVLGESNCAEKVDLTRFWKWDDKTIPIRPTAIRRLGQTKRGAAQLTEPEHLGAPAMKFAPRQAFPDRPGTEALDGLLAASAFRDMSGMNNVGELLEAGTKAAADGAHEEAEHAQMAFAAQLTHLEKVLPIIAELAIKAETGGLDPSSLGGIANALGGFSETERGASGGGAKQNGGKAAFDLPGLLAAAKKGGLL